MHYCFSEGTKAIGMVAMATTIHNIFWAKEKKCFAYGFLCLIAHPILLTEKWLMIMMKGNFLRCAVWNELYGNTNISQHSMVDLLICGNLFIEMKMWKVQAIDWFKSFGHNDHKTKVLVTLIKLVQNFWS